MSEKVSSRCIAIKPNGQRCKLRTTKSPYCWIHLQSIDHLRIKPSTIPGAGYGLFTTVDIPPDTIIAKYGGDRIVTDDPEYRGDYVLQLKDTPPYVYMDAKKSNTGIGSWANDARSSRKNNADLLGYANYSNGYLESNKEIRPNHEIFTGYNGEYWDEYENQHGIKQPARKKKAVRLTDDEVADRLERVYEELGSGRMMQLPGMSQRRRNEDRRVRRNAQTDAWHSREMRRRLQEAERALASGERRQRRLQPEELALIERRRRPIAVRPTS